MVTEIRLTAADGIILAAESHGPDDGLPVILAHGGGQTRHAWHAAAKRLGNKGLRAVALDLRGHGDSDWSPEGKYHIDCFAADLLEVSHQFERPPHLIGASLGGLAGMICLGELKPDAFSSLVLVDVTPTLERAGVDRVLGFMSENLQDGFASLEEAAEVIARYLPHRPKPNSLDGLKKNLRRGSDDRYRWHWDPRFVSGVLDGQPSRTPERLVKAARSLALPVLLVRGQTSELVSEGAAREFCQLVPHARFMDVTGAGHMIAGDRNDAFIAVVEEFLLNL